MRDWKYELAQKFFEKELDDAYKMGIREGVEQLGKAIMFDLKLQDSNLTKGQVLAWNRAKSIVEKTSNLFARRARF
jgi:glycine cleavage system H lipoate-binding protein